MHVGMEKGIDKCSFFSGTSITTSKFGLIMFPEYVDLLLAYCIWIPDSDTVRVVLPWKSGNCTGFFISVMTRSF